MNSRATSVLAWRLHRSAIAACLVYLRKIARTAFWEFCNTIGTNRRLEVGQSMSALPGYFRHVWAVAVGFAPVTLLLFQGTRVGIVFARSCMVILLGYRRRGACAAGKGIGITSAL